MRLALMTATVALTLSPLAAAPALAADSYAQASTESAEGVAALAEAGVKTVVGIVAIPVIVAGAGSYAVGSTAEALGDSGQIVGRGVVCGGSEAGEFASAPLSVTDAVIVKPQAAPAVPYEAQQPKAPAAKSPK